VLTTYKLVKLEFISPFRIGDENYIDAITIYRAMIDSLSELNEDFEPLVEGKIKFSSVFPLKKSKLFLKMPYKRINCQSDRSLEKDLKKLEYINYEILQEYEPPYEIICNGSDVKLLNYNKEKELNLDKDYDGKFKDFLMVNDVVKYDVKYRNRIDRLTNSDDPFTYYGYKYTKEVGFLVTGWNNSLEKAIKILEKKGFGSDKSVGYGKFKFKETTDININLKWNVNLKYLTGRAYAEGKIGVDIYTDKLDKVAIFADGGLNKVISYMVLLPTGSLVKNTLPKILGENKKGDIMEIKDLSTLPKILGEISNLIIIDPIFLSKNN
jgi:CRISPR type III-A-associated RAMP protein Csm4